MNPSHQPSKLRKFLKKKRTVVVTPLSPKHMLPDCGGTPICCELDLEGIVAKRKLSPYRELRGKTPRLKVKNPEWEEYSSTDTVLAGGCPDR